MATVRRWPPLAQQTRQAEGWLLVDDAHGIGVVGEQGRGSCWQQGVKPELLVVTFGKAFGVSGAALLCDAATADYFLQFSRHLIYSTAMPRRRRARCRRRCVKFSRAMPCGSNCNRTLAISGAVRPRCRGN
ncbi:8-amino-7-oxononanoate synthase [Pantoea agglomerans]|uniref:8-amino-7-oxononanoate synthase n=1 Tax=Enterobacter agglomerans TaxID=549 RepID=A0A379AJM3_ENTAG|nr:8-amino-7-oxononanoate synthase [Pantoea agglomerans]